MIIIISGPPGSGKTTVARMLSQRLNFPLVSSGDIFRSLSREYGMDLESFSLFAEKTPEIDRLVDQKILEIMKKDGDLVIDSRLAAWFAVRNGIHSFKVFLDASLSKRYERIKKREHNATMDALILRENSEIKRYKEYYGINFRDISIYDLVVNADEKTPEDVVEEVMECLEKWKK